MTREEVLTEYLADIQENRLPELRRMVASMGDGSIRFEQHQPDGTWVNLIPGMIDSDNRAIANYERIVAKLKKELGVA